MRWFFALAASLASLIGFAGTAAAQDCPFKVGDYVQVPWIDNVITPAIVLGMKEDCANYYLRLFEDDDPKTPGRVGELPFRDYQVAPLAGEPPHRKPFACPFETGEAIDFETFYDGWRPGTVDAVEMDCTTTITFVGPSGAAETTEVAGYSTPDRLRPQQAVPDQPVIVGAACETGDRADTVADSDPHALMKRAVLRQVGAEQPAASVIAIDFTTIREGRGFEVTADGNFLKENRRAFIGSMVKTYQLATELCMEQPGQATITRAGTDEYHCYEDSFADLHCIKLE